LLGRLRAQYERLMLPAGRMLARTGLSPNHLTLLSIPVGMACTYAYWRMGLLWGVLGILAIGFVDMLDGSLARATNRVTRFGGVLDHVLDRYAEYFIILGILLGDHAAWFWGLYALFGMVMASYTRAKAESIGGLARCTVGIAERQEKMLGLIAGSLIAYAFPWVSRPIMNITLLVVGTLSHITVIQRLMYTRRHADHDVRCASNRKSCV